LVSGLEQYLRRGCDRRAFQRQLAVCFLIVDDIPVDEIQRPAQRLRPRSSSGLSFSQFLLPAAFARLDTRRHTSSVLPRIEIGLQTSGSRTRCNANPRNRDAFRPVERAGLPRRAVSGTHLFFNLAGANAALSKPLERLCHHVIAALTRLGRNGVWRRRTPIASNTALLITAAVGLVEGSPAP